MPHFSVVIPLYNKAPYVSRAIGSVLGQTFTDFELMVVDNGSTDGGGDKTAAFCDPRLRTYRYEKNVGVGNARNKGVEMTSAPWLAFLDADDWWEPTFLEEMAGLAERHPGAGIYGSNYYIVKNRKKRVAPLGLEEGFEEGAVNYCQVYAKTLCMPLTSITVCMPRTVFNEMGGFRSGIELGEDFLLWIHTALGHPVVLLNKPLSNYNQDADPTYRATQNLIVPRRHMLWNLGDLETLEATNSDYKTLVDALRTYILMTYLVSSGYSADARRELAKVDWRCQPGRLRRLYSLPRACLVLRFRLLRMASCVKQKIRSKA